MQLPEESVEWLGIALQSLAWKDFPQSKGREFDRLLKGRFFQALQQSGNGNLVHLRLKSHFVSSMIEQGHWRGMNSSILL